MAKTQVRLARDEFDLSAPLARASLAPSRGVESIFDATGGLGVALGIARPFDPISPSSVQLGVARLPSISGPVSPSFTDQVGFLNALNPNGSLDTNPNNSYWEFSGETARKWDTPTAGTGAIVKYFFDPASGFSANEENTFLKAFGLWEAVADIKFSEANNVAAADVLISRGNDGGAFFLGNTTNGSGSTLGSYVGQTLISIDDSTLGFELTGSLDTVGGYGMSTVIHEVGHMIGLGHGGFYNGAVNPATQQYSAFDERQWTIMSYIFYNSADTAKFSDSYTVTGTHWGVTDDGFLRQAPHTWMPVDILAAQWLYGESTSAALNGGDTFGFNSTIGGKIAQFFDFTINEHPVITLFSRGTGNTLDASGFSENAFIDLRELGFSSLNGASNNVVIADGTVIETGIGGSGADVIQGNASKNTLSGKGGDDILIGSAGADKLNGAGGADFAAYSDAPVGVTVDLVTPANNTGHAKNDKYISIEGIGGSLFDDVLSGNGLDNTIFGDLGDDEILGRGGADTLLGGGGKDTLSGGVGSDEFVLISALAGNDADITDFANGEEVNLLGAAFGLTPGALAPNSFKLGTAAGDANDRFIYHKASGRLWFDADGTGATAKILIATFTNTPTLASTDFDVIG